ncbi:MAG: PD-(D/E)XK nuclease family protein, partial [Paracoccaceae bacterium]|nr:PD-(D/E)XK nuclease family protein [Paracoccaceae bacterium]
TFKQTGGRGVGGAPTHEAYRADLPGRVDLWPVIEKTDSPEDADWFDPVDRVHDSDHRVVLAEHIAGQIRDIVGTAQIPDKQGKIRPARFGDVLILVQRRSELFHQIIRACKALNLPIAGADRLKIGGELAVRDLCALLAFLDLPQDDLSLAAALRSPLFGLAEDDLFRLSHGRAKGQLLWDRLYHARDRYPETVRILSDLRGATDFQSPYSLLETILTRHGGRLNLLARLGPEAEEGIDALLTQALAYERAQTPSLTGFLTWMDSGEAEVKRQPDSAGDRIRVMTTHGAKGLEAPIVILPDTADRRQNHSNQIIAGRDTPVMWRTSSDQQPDAMRAALAQNTEAQEEERMRLLYVAMTRAQTWLIVCASGTATPGKDSWYRTVEAGMQAVGAHPLEFAPGQGLRFEHGIWPDSTVQQDDAPPEPPAALPDWAKSPAPAGPEPLKTISPSDLDPRKSLPGVTDTDEAAALRHGTLVHALLETLPAMSRETWSARASEILALSGLLPTEAEMTAALAEATLTLTAPDLKFLFSENSLAEVPVTASVPALGPDPLYGAIDRLVITKDEILIVDFKTNRILPKTPQDIPPGITLQLAAYAAALSQIYPDRAISCAVLWTKSAELMRIPHDVVSAALRLPTTP